jgi:excisionase family DNA binding protein
MARDMLERTVEGTVDSSTNADGPEGSKLLLTVEEAAQRLSIGRTRVFALIRTGELASVQVGSSRRVTPAALQQYVDGLNGPRPTGGSTPVTRLRRNRAVVRAQGSGRSSWRCPSTTRVTASQAHETLIEGRTPWPISRSE